MTSSLLLKCDTYASTLGRRPSPVAPSVITGIHVPRRPILSNWRPDRIPQRVSRRGRIAVVKASSETEAGVGTITVKFQCLASVEFGESMKIVGGGNALGNWDLEKSPGMEWGEGDIWTANVELRPGTYELKCVKIRGDGSADWEPGKNRVVEVSALEASQGVLAVDCRFLEAENTVVRSFDESDTFNLEEAGPDPHETDSSLANGITLPDEISIEAVDSKGVVGEAESGEGEREEKISELISVEEEKEEEEEQEGKKKKEEKEEEGKKMKEKEKEKTEAKAKKFEKEKSLEEAFEERFEKKVKKLEEEKKKPEGKVGGFEKLEEKFEGKLEEEFEGKEEDAEETKAQTVNEDVSELVNPAGDESSNAASKAVTGGLKLTNPQEEAAGGDGLAIALGLIAAPVVAWSEFTLKTSGCGLVPGPGGLLGALEGVSYLTVAGLAAYFLFKRFSDRPNPAGAGALVETATYSTIIGGLVVLALQIKENGYIPSALPDDKCPAQPTPLPELTLPELNIKLPDLKPVVSGFSEKVSNFSMPPMPSAPSIVSSFSPPSVPTAASSTPGTKPGAVSPTPAAAPSFSPPSQSKAPMSSAKIEERTEIDNRMVFPYPASAPIIADD